MRRLFGIFLVSLLTFISVPMKTGIYAEQDIFDPSHMVVVSQVPTQIDPAAIADIPSFELAFNVYETLISLDNDKIDSFVPKLATSWQISADGLTYQFTIRQGVKFHNGDILTTEDVEYSFRRILVTDYGQWMSWLFYQAFFNMSGSRDRYGNIIIYDGMIIPAITSDATTVTFHLPAPYPPFMQLVAEFGFIVNMDWCGALGEWPGDWGSLAYYNRHPSIINQQDTEPPGPHVNAMCGTGPFKLDYIQPGVECSIVKFNDYWGLWPAPGTNGTLDRVTLRSVQDWTTRKDQFLSGELDTIPVAPIHLNEVLGQEGVRCIYPLLALSCSAALFNFNISSASPYVGVPGGLPADTFNESGIPLDFFNDVNVRKAFAYAFNYSQLIDEALGGAASQLATPFFPELPFYDPTVPKYSTNLTAAAEFIKKAWNESIWTGGFNFTICYGSSIQQKTCEILKTNIESLNPKFHVSICPSLDYWGDLEGHLFTVGFGSWMADFGDPHDMALAYMKSSINYPEFQGYENGTVDSLIAQGFALANSSEREPIYHELQALYHEDCPSVPLFQDRGRRIERDWVRGWVYNPILMGMDYFYHEWKELSQEFSVSSGDNIIDGTGANDVAVSINTTAGGTLSICTCNIASVATIDDSYAVHSIKCISIDTTVPTEDIVFPVEIRVYYVDQEVVSAYVDQSTLRILSWSGSDWTSENDTGAVTQSDIPGYAGYVWAKIWHLSEFGAMGQQTTIHAVAPKGVRPGKTYIGEGFTTEIYTDVFNQGDYDENVNMTVYANDTLIGSYTSLALNARNSRTLSIPGNISSLNKGTYCLVAVAEPVPGERATTDNTFTGNLLLVTIPGDVNGDGTVDIYDAILLANAYNSKPTSSNWNPNADINSDNTVDIYDAIILANHYNQHYP